MNTLQSSNLIMLVQSTATESALNHHITQMMTSQDDSLLSAVSN